MANRVSTGGVVITSSLDYLNPEVNRPDIYAQKSIPGSSIYKGTPGTKSNNELISTLLIIVLSALIFIVIVSWFGCLQLYFDSLIVSPLVNIELKARLYYAITATTITILVFIIFFIGYTWWRNTHT